MKLVENSNISDYALKTLEKSAFGNEVVFTVDINGHFYVKLYELGDFLNWCEMTFSSMRKFKTYLKALDCEIAEQLDYRRNYDGTRWYRFRLAQRIVTDHFWHPHDLPFGLGDFYIWHQGRATRDMQDFIAPVLSNGKIGQGFVQKRGDARIIYRCNPNSSFYSPLPFEEELARYWRGDEVYF